MPEKMIITKEEKEKVEKIKYVDYEDYARKGVYNKSNETLPIFANVISNDKYTCSNGCNKEKAIVSIEDLSNK